jgi:glucose-1-phosphate adenylyltransferase
MTQVLAIVLAGGEGKRLMPLTLDRAKPAVPFAGQYRLVDFALSNLVNAGFLKIVVLTQYKSHSLDLHISRTWRMSTMLGHYVTTVPAQMRRGRQWFSGSADAVYQNLNIIGDEQPDYVCVFGADHIYRMDPRQMLDQHIASGAGVTVAGIRVDIGEAPQFGVIQQGDGTEIREFLEKPTDATGLIDDPTRVLASMGNYIFSTDALIAALAEDSEDPDSRHDMGGEIIPAMVRSGEAHFYDFANNQIPGATERDRAYWRDVGSLDSYFDASMDLVSVHPIFNLYNNEWPIYTSQPSQFPPAKFVFESPGRVGQALDSLVSAGVIVTGGTVRRSILSPGVRVESGAIVEDCVLMNDVVVGADAVLERVILDKNVTVQPGAMLGGEAGVTDQSFTVSDRGIVVVGKGGVVLRR